MLVGEPFQMSTRVMVMDKKYSPSDHSAHLEM